MHQEKSNPLPAKVCYTHLGGKLGMLLMEAFIEKGWIAKANPRDKHYFITPAGEKALTKLGIDLTQLPTR